MTARIRRLVSVGNVVIDIVAEIPAIPKRGDDVFATAGGVSPGGCFNVMVAAARQGLPTVYGGAHGTGPFGDLARAGLVAAGVGILQHPIPDADTGFDVAFVDDGGERTFVTVVGAEARLTGEMLRGTVVEDDDAVHLSGYSLLHASNRAAIVELIKRMPESSTVLFDPGPLGAGAPADAIRAILARADWWSGNSREATAATGHQDPMAAATALAARTARGGVIVRTGADGCILVQPGSPPEYVAGITVEAQDTNGAGDAHAGAFLAALAAGAGPREAVGRANACAAIAVTRAGPASAPTAAELDEILKTSRGE